MNILRKNISNQQPHFLARKHYRSCSSSVFFPSDSDIEIELELENSFSNCNNKILNNKSNPVKKNALNQISPAQKERMKIYLASSNIASQSTNYELVKLLETIAANHSTSVPVIIKSWKNNKSLYSLEDDEDDDDFGESEIEYYFEGILSISEYNTFPYSISLSKYEISLLNSAVI